MHYILAQLLVNKFCSFKGNNYNDNIRFCRSEFEKIIRHNLQIRNTNFAEGGKVVEVHSNSAFGSIDCRFVNQDTSLLHTIVSSSPTPSNVEEEEYRDGFNHMLGNSELLPGETDVFPLIEITKYAPSLAQLDDIITSIPMLFI